jgi:hypothetical protein
MKKTLIGITTIALFTSFTGVVFAKLPALQQVVNPNLIITLPSPTPTIKPILIKPGLLKNIDLIKLEFTNKRAELGSVQVTAKDATSITVNDNGTSIKVDVQTNTHFRRKFWGASNLNEISVGDSVTVIGRWTSESKTEIKAVLIRDLSIQKRNGVFFGTVKTITDTGFVMTTIQRGDETVTLDSTSKLVNRKSVTITTSDIQVGQTIRVRGMWDSQAFTITEVTEVKDFSIPVVPSPTP